MSESNIEKTEQSNPDDVLAAITSFNDPSIIINIFREMGWSYSLEIKETLIMAKQNANLSIKFKAIKHLRELLREAAETSGYVANVSQTYPNAQGGHTTFQAKCLANMLNPTKQIESTIKESKNDEKRLQSVESPSGRNGEKPDRGSGRGQSQTKNNERHTPTPDSKDRSIQTNGQDTRRAFPPGDGDSGGTEPVSGGETPREVSGGEFDSRGAKNPDPSESPDNPCIKPRPPTCDQDLFPGISSAED